MTRPAGVLMFLPGDGYLCRREFSLIVDSSRLKLKLYNRALPLLGYHISPQYKRLLQLTANRRPLRRFFAHVFLYALVCLVRTVSD